MDAELNNLLIQTANEADNDSFTHLTTCGSIKRWSIKPNHQTEFWKGYCNLVSQDKKLCLSERILAEIPIIVQLKLKFNTDDDQKILYNDDFLAHICHIYQSVIIETIEISPEAQVELVTSVLESKSRYYEIDQNGKYLTVDIRLHFPFAKVNVGVQKRIIRPRAIKLLNDTNALNKLLEKPIGSWSQIISDDFDSPISMFGSTENPDQPKLKLSHNWHWITKEMIDNGDDIDELPMKDIFYSGNHKDVQNGIIEDYIFEENVNVDHWLPMIFSLDYWSEISQSKINDGGRFVKEPKADPFGFTNQNTNKINWASSPTEESTIDVCEKMITLLNKQRYYEEPSWMDMGKALHHCTKGSEVGLLSWIKHTENVLKSNNREIPKFMTISGDFKSTMRVLYRTFAGKPITEKTLGHYARIDDQEEYAKWHMNWCAQAISKALNCSHTDVANAAAKVYWLDFLYCTITDRWFIFKDGKWNYDIKALLISNYLSGDFIRRLEATKQNIKNQIANSNDENDIETGNNTILKLDALIMKLKFVPFKTSIITELKTKLLNQKFDKSCDANPHLLGLENGIFEVVGGNIHFRAAKPEDYVLMNTGIEYDDTLTWESPSVIKVMDWMSQVFPDPKLKVHFLKFAASCIKGRNSDKIFPIFTGEGNNSKSMIVKLFVRTFGQYVIKFDVANFTSRNNNPSAASPQLARGKSVRLALADEAADDVPLHKEIIKIAVGGDSRYVRKLHDNGGDIEIFYKLILSCNKVPIIPKADIATKNRVKIFPFLGTWTTDASKWSEPNTYELKENFEDDIPGMAPAFLWILVQHFPLYSTEKLKDPEIVTKYTEDYWKDNDVYAQFFADCVTPSNDKDAKVSFNEMYSKFRFWWKESFDGVKMPEKPLIKRDLQARLGHLAGKYWLGISLVDDDARPPPVPTQPSTKQQPTQQPIQQISHQQIADLQSTKMSIEEMDEIIDKIQQPKTPESVKYAKDFTEKLRTNKHVQESMGDIPTRLWSPGIISAVSGEINLEDEGAVDI